MSGKTGPGTGEDSGADWKIGVDIGGTFIDFCAIEPRSGGERLPRLGAPYGDVQPLMRRLIRATPERVLWGTDWPHVNLSGPMPDDGDLVDLLGQVTTPQERRLVLVENPQAVFGFPQLPA